MFCSPHPKGTRTSRSRPAMLLPIVSPITVTRALIESGTIKDASGRETVNAYALASGSALSLATPHAKPCRTSALRAAVVSDELGHLDKKVVGALRFDGMIAFDRRRRRLPRVPVVSKYVEYVGELWRADEASTARSDVVEVGRGTTLATRVTTGVGLGLLFTYWTMVPNWAFALGMLLQALVAQLEYFRMAIIRGARPARRIVMAASIAAMAVAAGAPALHELVFPVGATWMMLDGWVTRATFHHLAGEGAGASSSRDGALPPGDGSPPELPPRGGFAGRMSDGAAIELSRAIPAAREALGLRASIASTVARTSSAENTPFSTRRSRTARVISA